MVVASLAQLLRIEASALAGRTFRRAASRATAPHAWLSHDAYLHTDRLRSRCSNSVQTSDSGDDAAAAAPAGNLSPLDAAQCTVAIGQVMAAQANFVRVKIERLDGSDAAPPQPRLLCVVRALLKKIKQDVLVGDLVRVVGIDWTDGRGMVEEVLPRSSRLAEPPVANVSHVLLVFSVDKPPLQPSAATRYLVTAEAAGLPTTVALNKIDLLTEEEAAAAVARVAAWGYDTVPVSVVTGRGVAQLEAVLRDRVTVVAGPSGAGKSSIINALRLRAAGAESTLGAMAAEPSGQVAADGRGADDDDDGGGAIATALSSGGNGGGSGGSHSFSGVELQAVGSVSERIGRGKHTTRNVTLVEMGGGGLLVDTPGFNQPDVFLPAADLASYFPEICAALATSGPCAFANCQHLSEPGCVVRGDWERYELYAGLHAEMRALEAAAAGRSLDKRRREGTVRAKSRAGGQIGLEARLETKAHRRVSRREVNQKLADLVKDGDDSEGDDDEAAARG